MRRAALALLLLAVAPRPAAAQADGACARAPEDAEVRARLREVERRVRAHEPAVRRWWATFLFLHATMGAGQAILAASTDDGGTRAEMLVGLTSSSLALLTLLVFAPPLMGAGDGLRGLPERTPEERLRKLRIAEGALRREADGIRFTRSWLPSVASAIYVTGASLTLLFGYGEARSAYTLAAGGAILGQARLLLRPTAALGAWESYAARYADAGCAPSAARPGATRAVRWALTPWGLGLGLVLSF